MIVGRDAGADVALDSAGIAPWHARIRFQAGRYYAEGLGTPGIRVNGAYVDAPRALTTGDRISVGPVLLAFAGPDAIEDVETEIQTDVDGAEGVVATAPVPPAPVDGAEGGSPGPPWTEDEVSVPRHPSGPVLESAALLQAVVRTRRRRQASANAPFRRLRQSLAGTRPAWLLAFVAALLAVLAAAALWLSPGVAPALHPRAEPEAVGADLLPDSFGLGEGVTWTRPELKAFSFGLDPDTRVVGVLRFQARDISPGEVTISLNGKAMGSVPADGRDPELRQVELVLPANTLQRGGRNELVFDNVRNPPASEPWRIWNLSLELIPLPRLPPDELLASAREHADRAARLYGAKAEASDHLFRAWRDYRAAWLDLEALDEKPELYRVVRHQLNLLARELDERCGASLLRAEQALQRGQRQEAREALEEVARYFPTDEHHCHNLALQRLDQYGL